MAAAAVITAKYEIGHNLKSILVRDPIFFPRPMFSRVSPVVQEKYPAKIPTQAYLVPSEAEFCLVYPKKNPHSQHARDFFPVQKQNGRRTPLLKISKCNVKVKLQMLETLFSSNLDKIY